MLVDGRGIADAGILKTDPVGEDLVDTPIYQMLNRLSVFGLAWYYDEDVLYITSREEAEQRRTMLPYNVGDLFDLGFEADSLIETIVRTIEPESWEEVGGSGVINLIGDVIFVRQNEPIHRQVKGLLQALRRHGRQTYVAEPPAHTEIRSALKGKATVTFEGIPIQEAIDQLIQEVKLDIRLDLQSVETVGVRERTPVGVSLKNTPIEVILQALLNDLDLTWILRDGVVWIVAADEAETVRKTAVYDVRDLCRDAEESLALQTAIASQDCENWEECGGVGTMAAPKPGILVLYNTESSLTLVLELLEAYRVALRGSKPRQMKGSDPDEVITVFYRLESPVAEGLMALLPDFVETETWKTAERDEAIGTIRMTASNSDLSSVPGKKTSEGGTGVSLVSRANSVLIIQQTRRCHEEIRQIVQRVQQGDPDPRYEGQGGGLGGGMGGGFGGGYFNIQDSPSRPAKQ